ncbi:MAG: glycoside hydrolase family 3 C-terminal domain-containing protein, partial [Solirubrobacterales bacterium]|nr:glycoside hydrolase family 3 C-terminal domain-containing protein [Solirubrobacterales bacterium]
VRPWCDTSLSPDQRAALLLAQLTRDEKISLLGGDELTGVAGGQGTHTGTSNGIARVGVPTIYFSDGPAGVRSGNATAMPSPLAIGASFDPKNSARDARVIADEVIKKGNDIVFAPTVDIVRTPLAGRVFEALGGEDPYLSSQLAVPWIKAVQAMGLIANVKHYAGNNQEGTGPAANLARPGNFAVSLGTLATTGNRMRIDARIDERTLHELYLPMFEAAVKKANVASVMCAYNKVNGPFACENEPLLEDILRDQWGFEGMTIADYAAAHDAGASLINGLDVEPFPGLVYGPVLVNLALVTGPATMADVDRHVLRYLRTLFAYGAMDRPAYQPNEGTIDQAANAASSRRAAEEGMVLLKNDGLLPLKREELDSIAVIGPAADAYLTGGGSSEIKPFSTTTPFEGITSEAGPGVDVTTDDGSDPARASQLASKSEVAIVVAASYSTEGVDRTCLSFECPPVYGDQDALIQQVAAANPKTVVVIESGGPVLTPWSEQVAGVLEAWYPGSEGGSAIARILFGTVNPSGHLPVTFPKSEADLPTAGDQNAYPGVNDVVDYAEKLLVGYRHYDAKGIEPAYPFGHGLSYTKFRYSDLRIKGVTRDSNAQKGGGPVVSITVKNRGQQSGVAVPQLYLSLPSTDAVPQPPKALKGFKRIKLAPGKSKRVRFALDRRAFSYWDVDRDRWRIVRGCAKVLVGSSSRKTPLGAPIGRSGACR